MAGDSAGSAGVTSVVLQHREEAQELDADGNPITTEDDDDDEDEQANMSLAAMEAALKPQVLEALDIIADDYAKLSDMQDSRISEIGRAHV